jgi:hypothetical protein
MKTWLLHHMHFTIFLDVFIHALLLGLSLYLFVLGHKFVKAVKATPGVTPGLVRFSYFFFPIAAFMTFCQGYEWLWCARHYAAWWGR